MVAPAVRGAAVLAAHAPVILNDYHNNFPDLYLSKGESQSTAIINRANALSLDAEQAILIISNNRAPLQQWDYNATPKQQWQLTPTGDGWFVLFNRESGKSLDADTNSMGDGGIIQQWDYNSKPISNGK